jgi:DNA-directed RNA polymerase beta subunit
MNSVSLVPRGNEVGPIMARPLRIHVSDDATCIIARHGLVVEGLLTSVDEEVLQLDVYGSEHRSAWLAPHNPFLADTQRIKLDERGVIRPGTVLKLDDILVSVLESDLPRRGRLTRPGWVWVRDNSWQTPAHWRGATVIETQILDRRELGAKVALKCASGFAFGCASSIRLPSAI